MATAAIFMPGSRVSMPNIAVPLTLAGVSRRLPGVPIRVKSFGILEGDLLRHRQARGLRRQLAEVQLAAACGMDDLALLGPAIARRHAPCVSRSRDQHVAGRGAGAAQRLPEAANGGRAPRRLEADQGIGIKLVVGRRMLELHRGEFHLQFLSDKHGDGGVGALPHLDLGHDHGHFPVGVDADEGIGGEDPRRRGGLAGKGGQADAQQQPAAGGSTRLDEGSAAEAAGTGRAISLMRSIGTRFPLRQPLVEPAACLMAARMRR
jgi:hypothetical protein